MVVGPSSPSFAHSSLWDGCVDRLQQEAEERASRQNDQARRQLLSSLQEVIRLCRITTMNINCALCPPDKLADELGSKMKITSKATKKIKKAPPPPPRGGGLAQFKGLSHEAKMEIVGVVLRTE